MKDFSTFESDRLIYREICESDADILVKWRSNPTVIRYFRNAKPITNASHMDWFTNVYLKEETRSDYIVIEKSAMIRIGTVSASQIDYGNNICQISYMIAESEYQRKGYASESASAIMDRLRMNGIRIFNAEIHKDNLASIRMIGKLGYKQVSHKGDFMIFQRSEV